MLAWCSSTIRTARSRTSGENLFDLAMTPSSQGMEPPENPARFILELPLGFVRAGSEEWPVSQEMRARSINSST